MVTRNDKPQLIFVRVYITATGYLLHLAEIWISSHLGKTYWQTFCRLREQISCRHGGGTVQSTWWPSTPECPWLVVLKFFLSRSNGIVIDGLLLLAWPGQGDRQPINNSALIMVMAYMDDSHSQPHHSGRSLNSPNSGPEQCLPLNRKMLFVELSTRSVLPSVSCCIPLNNPWAF